MQPAHKISAFGLIIWDVTDKVTVLAVNEGETDAQYLERYDKWREKRKHSIKLFNYLTHRAYDTASCLARLEFIADHVN